MCWRGDSNQIETTALVRKAMIAFLRDRVIEQDRLDDAELVIGELVGNVARHSPGPFCTEIFWNSDDRPVMAVHDAGSCFDVEHAGANDRYAESGRGLKIVKALVHDVTVHRSEPEGCIVLVTLDLHRREGVDSQSSCPHYVRQAEPPMCMRPVELRRQGLSQAFSTSE